MHSVQSKTIKDFDDLFTEINKFLSINNNKSKYVNKRYLLTNPNELEDDMRECTDLYKELYCKIDKMCNDVLIDIRGQCSNIFYDIRKQGYHTKVVEQDSFGPLCAIVMDKSKEWGHSYG